MINSDSKESTTGHLSECTAVPLNKPVVITTSMCMSNVSNTKTVVSTEQNKISTKVVPAISSCVLSINKVHSSKDTQPQDSTSTHLHQILIKFDFAICNRFLWNFLTLNFFSCCR